MTEVGEQSIRATYGDNHGRLATQKAACDPHDRFRVNQNIAPTA